MKAFIIVCLLQVALRATTIQSFRCWQVGMDNDLREAPAPWIPRGLKLRVRRIRADATNANIFHKSKLHVVELRCVYLTEPISKNAESWEHFAGKLEQRTIICNLARVRGTNTGLGVVGMLEKQMNSVGVQSWAATAVCSSRDALLDGASPSELPILDALPPGPAVLGSADATSGSPSDAIAPRPKRLRRQGAFNELSPNRNHK